MAKYFIRAIGMENSKSELCTRAEARQKLSALWKRTRDEYLNGETDGAIVEPDYLIAKDDGFYQFAEVLPENTRTGKAYYIEEIKRSLSRAEAGFEYYVCCLDNDSEITSSFIEIGELVNKLAECSDE